MRIFLFFYDAQLYLQLVCGILHKMRLDADTGRIFLIIGGSIFAFGQRKLIGKEGSDFQIIVNGETEITAGGRLKIVILSANLPPYSDNTSCVP